MFHVVKVTTLDLDKTNREYTNLKKEVSRLKSRDLSYADKETLLDKQVLLLKLEILRERVKAERSSAIASLYFYAGYNPFGCSFYADTPAVLADTFKKGFTSDRVILLNQAYEETQKNKEKTASDEALQTHSQDMQRGLKIDFSHRFSALSASLPDAPASALQPRIPLTGNAIPLIARLAIQLLRFGRIIRYALGIFVENTE